MNLREEQIAQQLIAIYPDSDPQALRDIAPIVIEFGCTDMLEHALLIATLYEWRAVLATLGPEGMTVAGMLDYEWHEFPGVKLCKRVDGMTVKKNSDGFPYLEPSQVLREDGERPVTGFMPVPIGDDAMVWLRQQGRFAIVDDVALRLD